MSDPALDLQKTLGQYLSAFYPAWTHPVVLNLTNINAGWESDVYTFDLDHGPSSGRQRKALVLRVYPGNDAYQKSAHEYRGMQLLRRAAYPVPEVYLLERDSSPLGAPFLVMERVAGQQLSLLFHGSESEKLRLLTQFCELLMRLHTLDWRPFVQGLSDQSLVDPQKLINREMGQWRTFFAQYPAPGFQPTLDWLAERQAEVRHPSPGPVHWDFHPSNILIRPDGSAVVIDWTQIAISDTRFDLAWTLLLTEDEAWRERILAEYERLLGRPVEDLSFFEVAAGVKRLYSTHLSISIGAEKLGMRPGAEKIMIENAPKLHAAYSMVFSHTHLRILELDALLGPP